jgi:site-specific DNA recombinase
VEVRTAIEQLDPVREDLFPAEQARIIHRLVERVDVSTDGIAIRLRTAGLASVAADLRAIHPAVKEAA